LLELARFNVLKNRSFKPRPEHSLATPLRRLGLATLIMTGFAVLLLTTALIARRRRLVLCPLAVLRDAAGRIGAGELRTPIPIHRLTRSGSWRRWRGTC